MFSVGMEMEYWPEIDKFAYKETLSLIETEQKALKSFLHPK